GGKSLVEGDICFWQARTGQRLLCVRRPLPALTLAYSPKGDRVLVGGGYPYLGKGEALLVDPVTGKSILGPLNHDQTVLGVAFSADGKMLLTGSLDGKARLWDSATGKPLRSLAHPERVCAVAFSPDGRILFTAASDGTGRFW